jgi:hypothetical protein
MQEKALKASQLQQVMLKEDLIKVSTYVYSYVLDAAKTI